MAKYFSYNNNYFTVEEGQVKQVNPNEIIGDAGDAPGGGRYSLNNLPQGYLTTVDPSQWKYTNVTDPNNPNYGKTAVDFGQTPGLATGGGWVNQDIAKLLGGASQSSATTSPYADFSNYLKETGQAFNPTTGFSGGTTQPQQLASIQQPEVPSWVGQANTPPQATNGFNRYQKLGNDVIDSTTGQKIDQATFQSLGLNFGHLNQYNAPTGQTGGSTGATGASGATTPTLGADDWTKYYGGDVAKEKAEAEVAKKAAETAYQTEVSAKTNLIEQSQTLFDTLFNSPNIQTSKTDRDAAKAELGRIDAEQKAAEAKVKSQPTVGWALAGQLRIISESYDVQRTIAATKYALANDQLAEAEDFANKAYTAGLNTLQLKIGLAEDALKHAENISAVEKSEYEDVLAQAQKLYNERKADQKEATDLYLQLAQMGVGNISPTMGTQQLLAVAGPVIGQFAQTELDTKKKQAEAELEATRALTAQRLEKALPEAPTSVTSQIVTQKATDILTQVNKIENSPNLKASVGFSFQKFIPYGQTIGLTPGVASFNDEVDRLKALLSIDNMKLFKGQGAVSDAERKLIADVGTSLNTNMSEENFKKELERIREVFQKITGAGIGTEINQADIELFRSKYNY